MDTGEIFLILDEQTGQGMWVPCPNENDDWLDDLQEVISE